MSNKHLHKTPHTIRGDDTAWWFEEAVGICVLQEYYDVTTGAKVGTRSVLIPWAPLRQALKRKDRP